MAPRPPQNKTKKAAARARKKNAIDTGNDAFAAFRKHGKSKSSKRVMSIQELVEQPWCYYCDRFFDDAVVLLGHMKAKHFKCDSCNRRLVTAGGLKVHLAQVHKTSITKIANALPERDSPDLEIFVMDGIPEDVMRQHRFELVKKWDAAADLHFRRTGNPPPGTKPRPPKRVREPREDMLKRLEAFVRRKQEDKALQNKKDATPKPPAQPFTPPTADPRVRPAVPAAAPGQAVDDLIASVQNEAKPATPTAPAAPAAPGKKKANQIQMRYKVEDTGPDELVDRETKYGFDRHAADNKEVAMTDVQGGYAGVVGGTNEAVDREMDG